MLLSLFINDFKQLENIWGYPAKHRLLRERVCEYESLQWALAFPLQVGAAVGELLWSVAKHAAVAGSAQPWNRNICWMENP